MRASRPRGAPKPAARLGQDLAPCSQSCSACEAWASRRCCRRAPRRCVAAQRAAERRASVLQQLARCNISLLFHSHFGSTHVWSSCYGDCAQANDELLRQRLALPRCPRQACARARARRAVACTWYCSMTLSRRRESHRAVRAKACLAEKAAALSASRFAPQSAASKGRPLTLSAGSDCFIAD